MSFDPSGGGGDDWDDIKDELRRLNKNFEQFLDALTQHAEDIEREESGGDIGAGVDLWNQGRVSPSVETPDAYIEARRTAANTDDIVPPSFVGGNFIANYMNVFSRGAEHLHRVSLALSDEQFDEFIRRWANKTAVNERLLDILKPSKEFFGVEESEGRVIINPSRVPFRYLQMYNTQWYFPQNLEEARISVEFEDISHSGPGQPGFTDDYEDYLERNYTPIGQLGLPLPTGSDSVRELVKGNGRLPREVNVEMARIIKKRDRMSLPEELEEYFLE